MPERNRNARIGSGGGGKVRATWAGQRMDGVRPIGFYGRPRPGNGVTKEYSLRRGLLSPPGCWFAAGTLMTAPMARSSLEKVQKVS